MSRTRILSAATFCLALLATLPASADPPVIERVSLQGNGGRASIAIEGRFDAPEYSVRARDGGTVLVIEVPGASLPSDGIESSGRSQLIGSVTASTNARGVRVQIALSRALQYRARASRNRITVELQPRFQNDGANAEPSGAPSIRSVHVERRDGRDRVVVDLDRSAAFRLVRGDDSESRLEIRDAALTNAVRRAIDGRPGSPLRRVAVRQADDRVVLRAEQRPGTRVTAIREGERIVWMFTGPDTRSRSTTVAREEAIEIGESEPMNTAMAAAFLSDVPLQVRSARSRRRYSGRRIDLDFKDADIHNILRLLAEVGNVNIVTSDEVTGTVTIRMRNVPWDQALDVILQAKGLGLVRRGNLIRVAQLETLEKEREAAIARQKQIKTLAPLETRLVPVSYATAEDLQPRVAELLSERGTVSVDERTNVLIVRDILENLDDVEELVRTLDTQTPQVLVEARIVEATSQYSRDVGIQWGGDVTLNSATGNPTGLAFPSNVGIVGGNFDQDTPTGGLSPVQGVVTPPNFAVNLPAITGTGQGGALGLTFGSIGGAVNLSVRLSAAESNGVVRIVSSPRILTLDNHEAHIAQGTLIPYSQVSAQGVQTAFQEARLELRVRPHVTSDGSVAMHVAVTRDEPDFTNTGPRGDPTILQREAETDLLIPDGHTAVIGGIYTRNTGRTVNQVPFFGDIPILGVLFQRRLVQDDRNELLIFLTPRIVNRAEALRE
ncbi:MAG: type IV pilus secretin PilQ [Myxococcota bacterium]